MVDVFTGLVQAVGRIEQVRSEASGGLSLQVLAPSWASRPVEGDSIALDGCCLTVAEVEQLPTGDVCMGFDVVQQTIEMTTLGASSVGDRVNIEAAATLETLLGGHLVQGHIDGVGTVVEVHHDEGNVRVQVRPPGPLMELIVPQGSITINGVSLTVASGSDDQFEVALIPTTMEKTTLGAVVAGDPVNLETDMLLRSVRHLMTARGLLPA